MILRKKWLFALVAGLSGAALFTACSKNNSAPDNNSVQNGAIAGTWTMVKGTLFYDNSLYGQANEYDTVNFSAPHQDTLIFTKDGRLIDITYVISYVGQTPADNRYI